MEQNCNFFLKNLLNSVFLTRNEHKCSEFYSFTKITFVMEKIVIGRRDIADLIDFDLLHVPVKVDSGAYTSSIHVNYVAEIEKEGVQQLEVVFLDENHKSYTGIPHYFKKFKTKKVRSSTGEVQLRYFIKTKIKLFDEVFTTEFSLTKRSGMKFPILLGRKILNKRFLIDTSKVNLSMKKNF